MFMWFIPVITHPTPERHPHELFADYLCDDNLHGQGSVSAFTLTHILGLLTLDEPARRPSQRRTQHVQDQLQYAKIKDK